LQRRGDDGSYFCGLRGCGRRSGISAPHHHRRRTTPPAHMRTKIGTHKRTRTRRRVRARPTASRQQGGTRFWQYLPVSHPAGFSQSLFPNRAARPLFLTRRAAHKKKYKNARIQAQKRAHNTTSNNGATSREEVETKKVGRNETKVFLALFPWCAQVHRKPRKSQSRMFCFLGN